MGNYERLLDTNDLVFSFLVDALEMDKTEADEICSKITKAELLIRETRFKSTLKSSHHRRPLHKTDDCRVTLRRRVFDELITFERLDDDDHIKLGVGGAKPKGVPIKGKNAIIIAGLPASGKSYIASQLADKTSAYVVDSDFAKRKIPEFSDEFGASLVHDESSLITYGGDEKFSQEYNLFEYCIAQQFNVVIPKIGASVESLRELRDALLAKEYSVHLVLVGLDRQIACERAIRRYIATERYVPLSLVFDVFGNEPLLTYYRVRDDAGWTSTIKISSRDLKLRGPLLIHVKGDSPAASLCKERI